MILPSKILPKSVTLKRNLQAIALVGAVLSAALAVGGCSPSATSSPEPRAEAESADPSAKAPSAPAEIRAEGSDSSVPQYQQVAQFASGVEKAHGLAVGPDNRIYVGGEKAIVIFDAEGKRLSQIPVEGAVRCLAVAGEDHAAPGRVYVGMEQHVDVLDEHGKRVAVWRTLGEKAAITSIAVGEQDVFVADAGNRLVWRLDPAGKERNRIGLPDKTLRAPGFIVPSPYFDVVLTGDGLLYAVNPGALRVEGYTFEGRMERHWGRSGEDIAGFFGCCNPSHLAALPDGRFVTAEKGRVRIKVYNPKGEFECVVAGTRELGDVPADVATDSNGRVLVLDPKGNVRVFEKRGGDHE